MKTKLRSIFILSVASFILPFSFSAFSQTSRQATGFGRSEYIEVGLGVNPPGTNLREEKTLVYIQSNRPMFLVSLTYKVPIKLIKAHLEAHVSYLKEQYALGHFLASGRKVPRTGGVIISNIKDRDLLEEILNKDPFRYHNLADYEITEFIPTMATDELQFLLDRNK